jgi:hypothetical protein
MNEEQLLGALSLMEAEPLNGTCTFYLQNNCPSAWGVVIASAGVNFYYKDGTSETDGPRPVQLSSGQVASFRSTKPAGCVKRSFLAMTVVIPGEGAKQMTHSSEDAGEGQCFLQDGIQLGPKSTVAETDLGASGIGVQLTPMFAR